MSNDRILKDRYRIDARLGRGAMGEVFRALDLETEDVVAIKTMAPDFARDPQYRKRFTREVTALQKLNHPNILGYIDAFITSGHIFLVMEYVAGGTLERIIEAPEEMSPERFKGLALKITDAMATAHEQGIIHRDLKPTNILLTVTNEPKIADFGLAKLADLSTMTTTGTAMGTLAYMPPEAFDALARQDHRGDIWALGVIFFELLSGGVLPFMGRSQPELIAAILTDEPTALGAVRRDLPAGWNDIISHCLEHHADFRYQTARELMEDLKAERRLFVSPPKPVEQTPPTEKVREVSPEPAEDQPTKPIIAPLYPTDGAPEESQSPPEIKQDDRKDWIYAAVAAAAVAQPPAQPADEMDEFTRKYMSHQAEPKALPQQPELSPDNYSSPWVRPGKPRKAQSENRPRVPAGLVMLGNLFAGSGILLIVGSTLLLVLNFLPMTAGDMDTPISTIRLLRTLGVFLFIIGLFFKLFEVEPNHRFSVLGLMIGMGLVWFLGFSGFVPTILPLQLLGLAIFLVMVILYFRIET